MTDPAYHPPKSAFRLFFRLGGTMVFIFIAWVLMFWFASVLSLEQARQFAEDGDITNARVLDTYFEKKRDSDGERKTRYYLQLEYMTQADGMIAKDQSVGSSIYNRIAPGDVIEISYLRSDPEKIEVMPGRHLRTGQFMRILAYLSMLIVLGSILFHARRVVKAVRARNHGQREVVEVLDVRKDGRWIFNKGYQLVWRDSTGREGKSRHQSAEKLMGYRPGDEIVVFRDGKRSWWAGDIGDRARS